MSYTMLAGLGATYTRGACYTDCENKCIEENGGVWIPLLNDYCASSCFDDAGCENLPYSKDPEFPDLPGAVLPPSQSDDPGSSPAPAPGGGGTTPGGGSASTQNGGAKTSSKDDEPTPVAPSGGKIALVLFTLGALAAGGFWLMRRKR
jgi:hypothetical protein